MIYINMCNVHIGIKGFICFCVFKNSVLQELLFVCVRVSLNLVIQGIAVIVNFLFCL